MNLIRSPFDAAVNELRVRLRTSLAAFEQLTDLPGAEALAAARRGELQRLTDLILATGDLPRNPDADELALRQALADAKALFADRAAVALQELARAEVAVTEALRVLAEAERGAEDRIPATPVEALAAEIATTGQRILRLAEAGAA